MPVYVPREIIHAAGMLPVGILGGGDQLEVIQGDAYYQSYICRIPRSTIELGLTGRLDCLDGMLFPSICDVIRNLSGMWKMLFRTSTSATSTCRRTTRTPSAASSTSRRCRSCATTWPNSPGAITDADLNASIAVYNDNRGDRRDLYAYRAAKSPGRRRPPRSPAAAPAWCCRSRSTPRSCASTSAAAERQPARAKRDNARVVINGSFCEQPPLALIKSIEMSGCYVVDDDFMLVTRWLLDEVPPTATRSRNCPRPSCTARPRPPPKYDATREEKACS